MHISLFIPIQKSYSNATSHSFLPQKLNVRRGRLYEAVKSEATAIAHFLWLNAEWREQGKANCKNSVYVLIKHLQYNNNQYHLQL